MVAIDVVRNELKLQPRRTTRSLILRVKIFSVNFVTYTFCKLLFCHASLTNVAGIDVLPAVKQRMFNDNIQNLAFFVLPDNL